MLQPSLHTASAVMLAHQELVETQHEAQFCFSPWREQTNSGHRRVRQIYLFTETLRCEPGEKRTWNWSSVYSRARLLGRKESIFPFFTTLAYIYNPGFDGSSVNLPISVIAGEAARNLLQCLRQNSLPDSHGDSPDPAPRPREPPSWSHRWQGRLFY
ncbi:hypothetical protein BC826DRAFT_82539 [Russula brevipes]|nr:hypothetical protein BC826DRAFT_82539 [Russula brevipes]